ncbi:MAG: hypothetical protein U0930_16375 [Pirellulales bacterium]
MDDQKNTFLTHLEKWLDALEIDKTEFDSRYGEATCGSDGGNTRRSWKDTTPRLFTQKIVFKILGVTEDEFWYGPIQGVPYGQDPVFYADSPELARFRGLPIPKKLHPNLRTEIRVGMQFWDLVESYRQYLKRANLFKCSLDDCLGLLVDKIEARPPILSYGHIASLCTHASLRPAQLPLDLDDAEQLESLLRNIGWVGPRQSCLQKLVCDSLGGSLLVYCSRRESLHDISANWLGSLDQVAFGKVLDRVTVVHNRLREDLLSGRIEAAVTSHVDLHIQLFPQEHRDEARFVLNRVLRPATLPCVEGSEHLEISLRQHQQLVTILKNQFSVERMKNWYYTEQAFCLANCLPTQLREYT